MTAKLALGLASSLLAAVLAAAVVVRKKPAPAAWFYFGGMGTLALVSAFSGLTSLSDGVAQVVWWQTASMVAQSFLPVLWLGFSLTYSRGNYREFLARWRYLLGAIFLLPLGLAVAFRGELVVSSVGTNEGGVWPLHYTAPGTALNILLLLAYIVVLMNLEQTFRATVGTTRWRVKFVVLGLAILFGTRIYTSSQALIFHSLKPEMPTVDSGALLIACLFMVLAALRYGFAEIDVYPSHALLQSSITILLVGAYLLLVGVLAQAVALVGGAQNFEARAFLILLALAALAILLLSDRLRQRIGRFISHHLKRPYHDVRSVWAGLSSGMSNVTDQTSLCTTAAALISKTFGALSVSVWLLDDQNQRLLLGASTSCLPAEQGAAIPQTVGLSINSWEELRVLSQPFNLDSAQGELADLLREVNLRQFRTGGRRMCVPLRGGGRCLGLAILADRVDGVPYSIEEIDLLRCIAEQAAAALLNLRLSEELMLAKQLEAFQTMSTFFVHDLKNAANGLNLMLQNLPIHFDDPAFREDALRGMSATVSRINVLIARLGLLRGKLELNRSKTDLNEVVSAVIGSLKGGATVELMTDLRPVPDLLVDREKIQSVITNLLLNAQDAVGEAGKITVGTCRRGQSAILSVSDNGCGMSPSFLRDGLFRPFQTTKKKGLGIGMFQSKFIVAAHQGAIQVSSEVGKGTTFRVSLPLGDSPQ